MSSVEQRVNTIKKFSNITVSATPTALSAYKDWDTQHLYGYYFNITVQGITSNSLIENIVLTDTLLTTVGYIVTTSTNRLTFYTQTNEAVSGTIISLITNEVA